MGYRVFSYETHNEANAFVEGVEYVNDSAVSVEEIREQDDTVQVVLYDEDYRAYPCESCGLDAVNSPGDECVLCGHVADEEEGD